jgi:hypothetical protein
VILEQGQAVVDDAEDGGGDGEAKGDTTRRQGRLRAACCEMSDRKLRASIREAWTGPYASKPPRAAALMRSRSRWKATAKKREDEQASLRSYWAGLDWLAR